MISPGMKVRVRVSADCMLTVAVYETAETLLGDPGCGHDSVCVRVWMQTPC